MLFTLRLLLAQSLVHPFEGVTWGHWLETLRREQSRISPLCWPRAVWISALSLFNSAVARLVEERAGEAIASTPVVAPVFILGHYRSGTTHLHDLLSLDPRFASPSRFQAFNPLTFLETESWLAPAGRAARCSPAGSRRTRSP